MNKNISMFMIIVLIMTESVFAKGVQVKKDQCSDIPNGFICYSPKEADEIDISQNELLSCASKLKECKAKPTIIQPLPQPPKKIYEKPWFRDTVLGTVVLSLGIMIGVAASE